MRALTCARTSALSSRVLLVNLLGCGCPIGVAQAVLLPCFTAPDGDDLLAELVEGVHIQCGGLTGVVGAGYDDVANPTELVVRPHGLDAQLALVVIGAVQGNDPSLGVVLVVRVQIGHCCAVLMSIVGAVGAHSGARSVGESR